MKILQGLIAIVALTMTLQASASTVSYFHKAVHKASENGVPDYISDLFGSLEDEHSDDNRYTKFFRNSRREALVFRFSAWRDAVSLFRNTGEWEAPWLVHETRPAIIEELEGSTGDVSEITVTPSAVPLPAAVWLFGSGIAGLFAFAYRRRG